jgi:hypothetical protein
MPVITRTVRKQSRSKPTLEGAGVHLRRAFGFGDTSLSDPFLLLDDFRGDSPEQYEAGFPWHPHRGIETITYMLAGDVAHGDSLGNRGVIGPGDVQWMTAGSGIIHQEMPQGDSSGRMEGFQLWANLPASDKMSKPRYREVKDADIPDVAADGVNVRIICGEFNGIKGPITDVTIAPQYLDVRVSANATFTHPTPSDHTVIAYIYAGNGDFDPNQEMTADNNTLLIFNEGDQIQVTAGAEGVRFLLISGRPLREPVAWQGPIVMNTRAELETAYRELQNGTFIKASGKKGV